jgi:hypothetical protein
VTASWRLAPFGRRVYVRECRQARRQVLTADCTQEPRRVPTCAPLRLRHSITGAPGTVALNRPFSQQNNSPRDDHCKHPLRVSITPELTDTVHFNVKRPSRVGHIEPFVRGRRDRSGLRIGSAAIAMVTPRGLEGRLTVEHARTLYRFAHQPSGDTFASVTARPAGAPHA